MTRRKFVLGLSVSALALAYGLAPEAAQAATIHVDVRPLQARLGGGGVTELLRRSLQQSMARAFADRPGTITVRIHTFSLSVAGIHMRGGAGSDYLEGEIIAGGRSVPLLVAVDSSSAGYWRSPNFDQQRVVGLADTFAAWAKRKI